MLIICPKCQRHIEPLERVERDSKNKKGKTYKITYCPYERCGFNLDLEQITVALWNKDTMKFEDYLP